MEQRRVVFSCLLAIASGACGSSGGGLGATAGSAAGGTGGSAAAGTTGGAGIGGAAGTQASGGDGAAGRCETASGGAAGIASGGTSGGVLVDCPASPPSGCCSIENLACAYPTKSCVCGRGSWNCYACPATRPAAGEGPNPLPDPRMWLTCQYGDVTCSYPSIFPGPSYTAGAWRCGVCPASRPTDGVACGNTMFECRYSIDTCQCGPSGTWKCATPSCETAPNAIRGEWACVAPGHFTCQYPALDQVCACGTISNARRCSCPAARPVNGSACMAFDGRDGDEDNCMYGDAKCSCDASKWNCMDPVCPTAMPAPGFSCSMPLSCAYLTMFCACDGATWSCS